MLSARLDVQQTKEGRAAESIENQREKDNDQA